MRFSLQGTELPLFCWFALNKKRGVKKERLQSVKGYNNILWGNK